MKKEPKNYAMIGFALLAAFALWTLAIARLDVRPIGPRESMVGFATLNGAFHKLTGVHMTLYVITDWLGLIPFGFALAFAILGLVQWIRRRRILAVDYSILVLGGFYLAVIAAYLYFESYVVNYRPVLINGFLEASFPSSTTLLVMTVMPTTVMQLRSRIRNPFLKKSVSGLLIAFSVFMVLGRTVCGVHWLSDIIGGALLSGGLVMLYVACNKIPDR